MKSYNKIKDNYGKKNLVLLSNHGNEKIVNIIIHKRPVSSLTNNFVQIVTFGKFNKLYKEYNGEDKVMHASLFCKTDCDTYFYYEKTKTGINSIVDKSLVDIFDQEDSLDSLHMKVTLNRNPTVMELFENTRRFLGDYKYFEYECKDNNCTDFIKAILKSNHLDSEENIMFVNEHITDIYENVPNKNILTGFTFLVDKWYNTYRKLKRMNDK